MRVLHFGISEPVISSSLISGYVTPVKYWVILLESKTCFALMLCIQFPSNLQVTLLCSILIENSYVVLLKKIDSPKVVESY